MVEGLMRLGVNHITKAGFLSIYHDVQKEAITEANICQGFKTTGLVPFDPEQVLSTLSPIVQTPRTPHTDTEEPLWESKTPCNLAEVKRQAKHIQDQRRLRTNLSHSPSDNAFKQLLKGYEMAVHDRAILLAENSELRAENKRQKQQRSRRRKAIATGGTLTIQEGQDRVSQLEVGGQTQEEVQNSQPGKADGLPRTRAPYRCSVCKLLSHNARTCPSR